MKVGLATKLGKKKTTTSKKIRDDHMSKNCGIIVIFSIFCQFGAIWKSDSGCRVRKIYVFNNSNPSSHKN